MRQRQLADHAIEAGAIGLGCMGMSWAYGNSVDSTDGTSHEGVIRAAVDLGVTLLDTADVYGDGSNEQLVGAAIRGIRDKVLVATKVGMVVDNPATLAMHNDATPGHIRQAVDASLRRLGTDVIDLYYLHRVDPAVPLTDSWEALADLVRAGKVRHLGLSEVSVEQAAAAHREFPVSAVESEMSLWTREPLGETGWPDPASPVAAAPGGIVGWCAANEVSFVAYAPLGRGFLTGAVTSDTFGSGDFRANNPRFQKDAMAANMNIVGMVRTVAERHSATPAQIAIAWVLAKGERVFTIPGSDQLRFLVENVAAADIELTEADLAELDHLPRAVGARY